MMLTTVLIVGIARFAMPATESSSSEGVKVVDITGYGGQQAYASKGMHLSFEKLFFERQVLVD